MSLETDLKDTIEKLGTAFEEFKSTNNALIKKGVQDALAEVKLDRIGQTIDDLTGKKDDLEKRIKLEAEERQALERKLNQLALGARAPSDEVEQKALAIFNVEVKSLARQRNLREPGEVTVEAYRLYKQGFEKSLRVGTKGFTSDEEKAMQIGIDADGGYLVPPDTTGRITTKLREMSPMRQIADVQLISSDKLEGIEDLDEADAGWVGETGTRNDTTTPQVGKWEVSLKEMYAQPKATQSLLDDSIVDIESWLAAKVADKFARIEGSAFCIGDGILKPRGFTTYTTAATGDDSRSWGQFEHIVTGVNGDFPAVANNPSDKLIDLESAFRPGYLQGAAWTMPRAVLAKIRKFKDGNGIYIWQPGLSAGSPATLLTYPVVLMQDMPALSSNGLSLALGNFKVGYQIVDRAGVRVLRDPFTGKPYVKFYTTKRTGGAAVNFEAIKFLKFST